MRVRTFFTYRHIYTRKGWDVLHPSRWLPLTSLEQSSLLGNKIYKMEQAVLEQMEHKTLPSFSSTRTSSSRDPNTMDEENFFADLPSHSENLPIDPDSLTLPFSNYSYSSSSLLDQNVRQVH
jgi:hypothetical protein